MITLYLLKGCKYCSIVIKYLSRNPVNNLLLSVLTREKALELKKKDPRLKSFPILFLDLPNKNGTPKKKVKSISGSSTIINYFKSLNKQTKLSKKRKKTKYGESNKTLNGSNIDINYYNNNEGNIKNIREYRSNCFGKSEFDCHVMDRPFGPMDNQFILQNYQPKCSIPNRSHLTTQNNFFGNSTPGTVRWNLQKESRQSQNIPLLKTKQNQSQLNINIPRQYKDNHFNVGENCNMKSQLKDLKSNLIPQTNFGKYKSALDNSDIPFLTYGAGGTTFSRVTSEPYLFKQQQNPINSPSSGFISGNIKQYANNPNNFQPGLKDGLNSDFSINAQGIKKMKFGKENNIDNKENNIVNNYNSKYNSWTLPPPIYKSEQQNLDKARYIRRDMYPYMNMYGDKHKKTEKQTEKKSKRKPNKYTSPLGIEITF